MSAPCVAQFIKCIWVVLNFELADSSALNLIKYRAILYSPWFCDFSLRKKMKNKIEVLMYDQMESIRRRSPFQDILALDEHWIALKSTDAIYAKQQCWRNHHGLVLMIITLIKEDANPCFAFMLWLVKWVFFKLSTLIVLCMACLLMSRYA